jgi:hypothetical protein
MAAGCCFFAVISTRMWSAGRDHGVFTPRSLAGSGFKLLQLSMTSRPAPAPGGVLFVRNQLSVALDTASIGRPFSVALERRLSQVRVARAKRYVP